MNPIRFAPSMMCCDLFQLKETLDLFAAENVDYLHIDVMDGVFVPNLMLGASTVSQFRKATTIPLDLHLMAYHPENMLTYFDVQEGDTVSVHIESTVHIHRLIRYIKDRKAHPLVALNPGTCVESIREIINDCEGVLLMTVDPGFARQKMIPGAIDKVRRMRTFLDENGRPDALLEIDGGLGLNECIAMKEAGADTFVLGTAALFHGNVSENLKALKENLK